MDYINSAGQIALRTGDRATDIALSRSARLTEGEQKSFMKAFQDARKTATRGGDLELLWRAAVPYPCAMAGHIEGVASARAEELP